MNAHHPLRLSSWLLLSLMLLSLSTWADVRPLDVALPGSEPLSLTTHVGVLEDVSRRLTLEDVRAGESAARFRYESVSSASFALGFTRSAYWFRLSVENSGDRPVTRLLVVDNPRISLVDAHIPDEQGTYRSWFTGADRPQTGKAYDNRNFVFPLSLPAHSQRVVYLRVESSVGLLVPLQLWSARHSMPTSAKTTWHAPVTWASLSR